MADWSSLNKNVLEKIGKKFDLHTDHVRCRAVCVAWRSSLPENIQPLHLGLPSLILPPKHNNHDQNQTQTQTRGFLSLFDDKVYDVQLPAEVCAPDKLFRGSSQGWIVVVGKTPSIYLFNPTLPNNQLLQLPPATTFPEVLDYQPERVGLEYRIVSPYSEFLHVQGLRDLYIQKLILSSSPTNTDNYIAMTIYGEFARLAFCRRGEETWTVFSENCEAYKHRCLFCDVVFYKDNCYMVDYNGVVFMASILDLLDSSSTCATSPVLPVQVFSPPKGISIPNKLYLVESSGDLLLVGRYITGSNSGASYRTTNFKVFKLNFSSTSTSMLGKRSKKPEKSLGNRVLFLGFNQALSLPSSCVPGSKGNCIYFTDDNYEGHREGKKGGADIGIFDYKSRDVRPLPSYKHHSQLVWPPPIWLITLIIKCMLACFLKLFNLRVCLDAKTSRLETMYCLPYICNGYILFGFLTIVL